MMASVQAGLGTCAGMSCNEIEAQAVSLAQEAAAHILRNVSMIALTFLWNLDLSHHILLPHVISHYGAYNAQQRVFVVVTPGSEIHGFLELWYSVLRFNSCL